MTWLRSGLRGAATNMVARPFDECFSSHQMRACRRYAARQRQECLIQQLQQANRLLWSQLHGTVCDDMNILAVPACIAERVNVVVASLMEHRKACLAAGRNIHTAGVAAVVAASLDPAYDLSAAKRFHRRRNTALHNDLHLVGRLGSHRPSVAHVQHCFLSPSNVSSGVSLSSPCPKGSDWSVGHNLNSSPVLVFNEPPSLECSVAESSTHPSSSAVPSSCVGRPTSLPDINSFLHETCQPLEPDIKEEDNDCDILFICPFLNETCQCQETDKKGGGQIF